MDSDGGGVMRRARTLSVLAAIAGLAFIALLGFWKADGGHWYVVRTPSMGASATVGTLLWVEPVSPASVEVGEFVSFHAPIPGHPVYSHRIVAVNANGTFTTKGDANPSPDPWQLPRGNVIGKVVMRWWGVGWLLQALPVLGGGGVVVALGVAFLPRRWRLPLGTVGAALVVSAAVFVYRPLVRAAPVLLTGNAHSGHATYVSTGLLPLRLSAAGSGHVDLADGHTGTVATHLSTSGHYLVTLSPHLPWWWWPAIVAVAFVPALVTAALRR